MPGVFLEFKCVLAFLRLCVYILQHQRRALIFLEEGRMNKVIPALILTGGGIVVFAWFISSTTQQADMLIINAKVYTVDAQNSVADAIAIHGDKIAAVGTTEDLKRRYISENIFDARGKTVVPGFIDSHGHVSALGSSLVELNLVGTTSAQEVAEMVAKKASSLEPGQWIRGRGWDQNVWTSKSKEKPFPSASMLDKSSPNNPVVLFRVDGHAVWLNSQALSIIERSSEGNPQLTDVEGGRIVRDAGGKPTGVFIDNAVSAVMKNVPSYSKEEIQRSISLALEECLKLQD